MRHHPIAVRVLLSIRCWRWWRTVVAPMQAGSEAALPTRADPALVKALALAFRYRRLLDEGRYASVSEMAGAEKIERGYLGTLLRLTLLAPEIVEATLNDAASPRLHLPRVLEPFPTEWHAQRAALRVHSSPRRSIT